LPPRPSLPSFSRPVGPTGGRPPFPSFSRPIPPFPTGSFPPRPSLPVGPTGGRPPFPSFSRPSSPPRPTGGRPPFPTFSRPVPPFPSSKPGLPLPPTGRPVRRLYTRRHLQALLTQSIESTPSSDRRPSNTTSNWSPNSAYTAIPVNTRNDTIEDSPPSAATNTY
jgi:hypothetical protein